MARASAASDGSGSDSRPRSIRTMVCTCSLVALPWSATATFTWDGEYRNMGTALTSCGYERHGLGLSYRQRGPRKLVLTAPHEGFFHCDGVGLEDAYHVYHVGKELVQTVLDGNGGLQSHYSVVHRVGQVLGMVGVQQSVPHAHRAGVYAQHPHSGT